MCMVVLSSAHPPPAWQADRARCAISDDGRQSRITNVSVTAPARAAGRGQLEQYSGRGDSCDRSPGDGGLFAKW